MHAHVQDACLTAAAATNTAVEMEGQRSRMEKSYAQLSAKVSDLTTASSNTKAEFTAKLARSHRTTEVGVLAKTSHGSATDYVAATIAYFRLQPIACVGTTGRTHMFGIVEHRTKGSTWSAAQSACQAQLRLN